MREDFLYDVFVLFHILVFLFLFLIVVAILLLGIGRVILDFVIEFVRLGLLVGLATFLGRRRHDVARHARVGDFVVADRWGGPKSQLV